MVLKDDAFICATPWIPHEHVRLHMEALGLLEGSVQQIPIMASLLRVEKPGKTIYSAYKSSLFLKIVLLADFSILFII